MAKPADKNDFDPNELIRSSAEHEKSLTELQAGLTKLEKRVGDNAALAKSFKDAFENDKKMDAVLTSLICKLIEKDDSLKEAVTKAVKKVDREWWNGAWKKIATAVGAVVLLVIGAVIGHFIK
jgi:ElaB/YqjD/DUF883 family membrane-anchored ribosome-binding protein